MVEQIQLIMKAQILKIAGVKSEKEFYKKYPSEEAFMKVHGKAFKKAQFGTLIGGATPKQTVAKPMSFIDYQEYYDDADKVVTGKTKEERDQEAYQQALLAATAKGGKGGGGGGMGSLSSIMSMAQKAFGQDDGGGGLGEEIMSSGGFGAIGGGIPAGIGGGRNGRRIPVAQNSIPPIDASLEGSPDYQQGPDEYNVIEIDDADLGDENSGYAFSGGPNNKHPLMRAEKFNNMLSKIGQFAGKYAGPVGQIGEGLNMLKAGKRAKLSAQQQAAVSDVAARASLTREEESKRRYVRPEDIQNTGEEFFPIYGVGTNVLTRNGGAIRRAQDGSYITGNPTEIQNTYSPEYTLYDDLGYEPLYDSNQVKSYYHGGRLHQMADGGGVPWGQIGGIANNLGQSMMGGEDGGGKIGSTIGSTAGTLIGGPLGGAIGGFVGGLAGNLLDTNDRDTRKAQAKTKNNIQRMALNSAFQGLNAQNNRYVRNGGDIDSYEDGGYMNPEYNPQLITMFGDHTAEDFADYANKYRAGGHLKSYTEPSERAMETYAMGGQLKTHWGGKAETMSHNPYMPGSGETVVFRGQSHNESDRKGNTGIGITYGESPVEVERGEPMFEMEAGGEINPETGKPENTGVVFGNMPIDKKVAGQFNDPDLMEIANKYHGKKFKNVGIELAKQEAKQNKIIDKNAKMLDSFKVETSLDKAKFAAIQANMEGADAKLRNIANTKITLANYQNAINDAKEELSSVIGENLSAEDLARGYAKLDKDPVTMDAKWGGNIAKKAKAGITTTDPPKTFKTEREANLAGYKWTGKYLSDGKTKEYTRTIKKYSTKTDSSKAATAMDNIPKQSVDKGTGFAGGVTKEKFEQFKKRFPDYPGIDKLDPKDPISLHDFKTWANAKAKAMGSTARIMDDPKTKSNPQGLPIFGDQFVSFNLDESKKSTPAETEEVLTATVEEPGETPMPEEKAKFPWQAIGNAILPYFRPTDQEGLDMAQLYPEMFAMATNQVEPVPAQSYQPELIVPYDISLQAQRNAVIAGQRALEKQLGYNPAAQANVAPAAYNAINEINEKEFIANQGLKNQVYTGNVNTMNEAKKINLGIFADQWAKQSLALSNTKATTQAALNSIADKYAKNKLENRKLSIYENMYNYRFGKSGRAQNYNPLQFFDYSGSGSSDKSGGLAEGKEFTYDKYGNIVGVKSIDKDTVTDADLEAVGGTKNKNGGYTKIKTKNGSILRDFKNL
jgi:hypothetical protein